MLPYYFLFLALSTLSAVRSITSTVPARPHPGKRGARAYGTSIFVLVVLFSAARGLNVGADIPGYARQYDEGLSRAAEPGFTMLTHFLRNHGAPFRVLLVITAIAICGTTGVLIHRLGRSTYISWWLYLTIGPFTLTLSGLRQTLAITFTGAAFYFLIRGRPLVYIALVATASTFHNSAIALLPLVALHWVKLKKQTATIGLLTALASLLLASPVAWAVRALDLRRYDTYLDDSVQHVNPFVLLIALVIPVVCIVLWPEAQYLKSTGTVQEQSIMFALSLANVFTTALAFQVPILTRYSYYFSTFYCILIANSLLAIKNRHLKMLSILVALSLSLAQFVIVTPSSRIHIVPYSSSLAP